MMETITWQEAKKKLESSRSMEEARMIIGKMKNIPKNLQQESEYGKILVKYSQQDLKRFQE